LGESFYLMRSQNRFWVHKVVGLGVFLLVVILLVGEFLGLVVGFGLSVNGIFWYVIPVNTGGSDSVRPKTPLP
jgi:hypothetical protein